MKQLEKTIPAFLMGGGEMGELIRSFDWSTNPLGSPETWPQSLQNIVGIMLSSPFAMYIAWGKDYIQLYNDGYRPILGSTKHPHALGRSSKETFSEIWQTIGPMFDGVMKGTPVHVTDFKLQLDRNGYLEDCVFDFSYSPIRVEDGEVGGMLNIVIETTEKVKAAEELKEKDQELEFAIDAAELGIWDLNPATNKFRGNSRLKEWFGLRQDEEIELPLALSIIADKDRDIVTAAIETAMQPASGGQYDITYTIIPPHTKKERIVRAKGRASFTADGIPYRFNGTLQDVTKEILARQLLTEREQQVGHERKVLYNSLMNAPAAIAILQGDTFIYEFANAEYEKILGRKITIGKTVQEVFPEMEQQGIIALLNNVFSTGEPLIANEFPVEITDPVTGKVNLGYYNTVVQPITDEKGNVERLLSHGVDATQQVVVRKQIEEANKNLRFAAILTENISDAVIVTDMDHVYINWNKGAENLYGFTSQEVIGQAGTDILPTQFLSEEEKNTWHEKLETTGKWQGEVVQLKKDGTPISVHASMTYVYGENEEPVAIVAVNRDITERIKAQEKIAASENQFRTFADSIQNLAWIANADGSRSWYNQQWYDYTGTTFEEMQGLGWQKVHHPDHINYVIKFTNQALKKNEVFELIIPLRRYDGEYRWFLTRGFPVLDANGNVDRWIGTNTDITEQKAFTEELETKVKERTYQLHIQNETFKQAEESSLQGSYSFNLTTGQLNYSDNLYRLIGYEPNEFEPSLEEFNKHVHPDDRELVTQAAQQVLENELGDEWYYRMSTRTGRLINIKATGRVIESGDEKLLVGTLQDITKEFNLNKELQEKEAYRRQIINSAPDAIIVIDENNIINLWNPKTEEIFGWKSEEVVGLNLTEVIIPDNYREGHRQGMKRFLSTGESRIFNKTLDLTALHNNGKEFPISLTVSQATQEGEKLFIAFIRDITLEKKNKEELIYKTQQLETMNQLLEIKHKELEHSNTELASFSYVASHDLQEPLRKIQTFGKRILETETFSEKTQDYFNRMISASERMQNLIISLLEFSRTNTNEVVFEPCDLNVIVEETKSDLQITISEKGAIIEHENLPTINGIRIQLAQLVTNLIDNAIKYSRSEVNPHIIISAALVDGKTIEDNAANKHLIYHAIQFADNGIGFEQEFSSRIFELFQRLHGKNEYSGTGIGLGIVKKIATNHKGFIRAVGNANVGSVFTLYIPTTS